MIELPNASALHQEMRLVYQSMEPDVFYKNHWDLQKSTKFSAQQWKEFLMLPAVAEYIDQELALLVETSRREILKDIAKNQKSVGVAQLLNALDKTTGGNDVRSGPIFVYTYIPVNENEMKAPNVHVLDKDPFRKEE